jgi:hypothetical protein
LFPPPVPIHLSASASVTIRQGKLLGVVDTAR